MTARTTTVTINAQRIMLAAARGWDSADITSGPVHVLLRNRRYGRASTTTRGVRLGPTALRMGPDVDIEDDGDIVLTGGAAESFTFDNTNGNHTITAQVVPVGIDQRGYPGAINVNWFSSGASNLVLKNRRYNMVDVYSASTRGRRPPRIPRAGHCHQ